MLLLELPAASGLTFHTVQGQDFPRLPQAGIRLLGECKISQMFDKDESLFLHRNLIMPIHLIFIMATFSEFRCIKILFT